MKGTIISINTHNGFHAVRTSDGDITVFELLESLSLEAGDYIEGHLDSLGSQRLQNITQRVLFDVFVQDIRCSESRARDLLNR